MKRKLFAFALVASLCASLFAGCGGSTDPSASAGPSGSEAASPTAQESQEAAPGGERKTLTIEVFDLGVESQLPIGDNFWCDWMQSEFGDPNNIDLEFMPIPRTEEVTKMNILMSSGDAPDIIYTYQVDVINNYIKQGGLADLGPAIEQHGANIKSFLGDTLEYGVFSGTQYVIPQKRLFTGIVGSQIRKDWLDALGLPVPSTKEEFVSTLQAFKDNDPAGDGRTIPWGMSADLMTQGFYSLHYTFKQEMSEEDFYTVNPWEQPGYKDGLEWVNSIFSQGLISPEFALDKDSSQLKAAISNGQVGFYLSNVGQYHHASSPVIASLLENVPEAEYVPCYPFENAEGKYPKLMYYPYGHYLMVPAASQVVDEAVMFLDWMSQSEVLFTLTSGFEGENYEMKDGVPVDLPYEGEKKLSSDHNNDYVITLNGRDIGDYEQNLDLRAMGHAPHEQFFKDSYAMAATDGVLDPWSFTGFQEPVQSEAKYGTTLNEKRNEMFVRLYMCTPGEFSGLYDSLVEEYMEIGGREVAAERKEVYQRTMG